MALRSLPALPADYEQQTLNELGNEIEIVCVSLVLGHSLLNLDCISN